MVSSYLSTSSLARICGFQGALEAGAAGDEVLPTSSDEPLLDGRAKAGWSYECLVSVGVWSVSDQRAADGVTYLLRTNPAIGCVLPCWTRIQHRLLSSTSLQTAQVGSRVLLPVASQAIAVCTVPDVSASLSSARLKDVETALPACHGHDP